LEERKLKEDVEYELRMQRFVNAARLMFHTKFPSLEKDFEKCLDDICDWYRKNRRDMTLRAFHQILKKNNVVLPEKRKEE